MGRNVSGLAVPHVGAQAVKRARRAASLRSRSVTKRAGRMEARA